VHAGSSQGAGFGTFMAVGAQHQGQLFPSLHPFGRSFYLQVNLLHLVGGKVARVDRYESDQAQGQYYEYCDAQDLNNFFSIYHYYGFGLV